jgi:hypothetical protein
VFPPDQWLGGYCIDDSMQKIQSAKQFPRRLRSSGWSAAPNLSLENYAHRVSIPKYAAELGVDPQADFANRPESQGLLDQRFYIILQVHLGF